ncbi:glycosyltransferase [Niastella caeni]|uniref:Glycosyltransferase n=1 Tax=Niastella caeni TaxID=2569763 RepID=A0A4S8HGN5_9BACT|nr:glycosyltransferase [Niastella caeni]THU34085.1 glycosyltransferase [Niastella caeni]
MSTKKFAAFVVTFNRAEILMDTIHKIFTQTVPPEKLLVVDNGTTDETKKKLDELYPEVAYIKMGYNAGPAGGDKVGLEILANEGYEWIFWGDDNDPPPTQDTFEKLLLLAEANKNNCGQVGMVGSRFNKLTGLLQRASNEELRENAYIEVDTIGGGQCKIVNAKSILNGVLPEAKLFFGFEDLDFDLSQKKAGYRILVHSDLFLNCRERWDRLNVPNKVARKKDERVLWRDYYSIRNALFIMKKHRHYLAFLSILMVSFGKSILSFKHGFRYGTLVTKNTCKAVRDYGLSRYYKSSTV